MQLQAHRLVTGSYPIRVDVKLCMRNEGGMVWVNTCSEIAPETSFGPKYGSIIDNRALLSMVLRGI